METGKGCVLVVDDHQCAADTLVELLRVHGVEAYACYSTDEGYELALRLQPSVVIIEPAAGGKILNGLQLAAMLHYSDPVPMLVAFTGRGGTQDGTAAMQNGFDAFLLKPSCWENIFGLVKPATRPW